MDEDEDRKDDIAEGEYIDLDEGDVDVEDTDDGGALVTVGDRRQRSEDFYANLAEDMPEGELDRLATYFTDLIERDRQSRKRRDEQYAEGLRRTGLGDDAPGGATFEGASKVVHPMLVSATVDFAARSIRELFPPEGPVKDSIPGDISPEKVRKAKRKRALMNWQLTTQCPEARSEIEQMLTQVPMGGAQYLKLSWNEGRNRPSFLFVAIDDMLLPYAASSFYSAQRKTHVQYLTRVDFEQRIRAGEYRDIRLSAVSLMPDQTDAAQANDKIEGREDTSYNEDGLREVYEIYALCSLSAEHYRREGDFGDIGEDDEAKPYIITIDKTSGKVLSIYRNWDELDDSSEELQWFVEFPFVPWRGAYPIGLPHMIGGLSTAATGALRALLDAAHIQNTPSGMKLKGVTRGGQDVAPLPGEIVEIDGGLVNDDIRKLFMPMPYNQPSGTLFQLLGFIVDAAQGVVRTTFEDMAEQRADVPVGTTLARLEQAMVVYRAIHGRLHDAMQRMLGILHRLNGMYLDDEKIESELGEELATRADFEGPLDVVPVSDPNIFSETQRVMQGQAIGQRAAERPDLYDARKVEEFILATLKIPDAENLLVPAVQPKEQNAVNENVAATVGRAVNAFPEQDHLAHLTTHIAFMLSPTFGMNPLSAPVFLPIMLNHINEHVSWWYASTVFKVASEVLGKDLGDEMKGIKDDHESRRALDRMLAEATQLAVNQGQQQFAQLPQIIQQAQQVLAQFAPKPQIDPRTEAAMAKVNQAAQSNALDNKTEIETEQMRQAGENQRKMAELQVRKQINDDDNATAATIASAEINSGQRVAMSSGGGSGPNPRG